MLTPAGIKKKAMLDSRKSDFSWMCLIFRIPVSRQMNRRIMPMTVAGKSNGRKYSTTCASQQILKIIPICLMIFITIAFVRKEQMHTSSRCIHISFFIRFLVHALSLHFCLGLSIQNITVNSNIQNIFFALYPVEIWQDIEYY